MFFYVNWLVKKIFLQVADILLNVFKFLFAIFSLNFFFFLKFIVFHFNKTLLITCFGLENIYIYVCVLMYFSVFQVSTCLKCHIYLTLSLSYSHSCSHMLLCTLFFLNYALIFFEFFRNNMSQFIVCGRNFISR